MRLIDADELPKVKFHALPYTHIVPSDLKGLQTEAYERGWNDAIDAIVENAETADAVEVKHGKWIPVTERLPEKNGRYLVTRGLSACGDMWNRVYIINYSDLMGLKSKRIWWYGNVGKSDFVRVEDVIAWMPLPEPYREETTNAQLD